MKHLLLVIISCAFASVSAQNTTPAWVNTFHDTCAQGLVIGIVAEDNGDNYTLASLLDTNQSPPYNQLYFLDKYDANGNFQWRDTFLGVGIFQSKLVLDHNGYLYICAVHSSGEFLILKISPSGGLIWQNQYLCPSSFVGNINCADIDDSANLYLAGTSPSLDRAVMMKCDSSGGLIWITSYDHVTGGYDRGNAIASDGLGNAYVGIASMDANSDYEYAIAKYSPSGQFLWEKRLHQFLYQGPLMIRTFNDTTIVACGWSIDSVSNGNVLTVQYDSSGNIRWWRSFDTDVFYNVFTNAEDEPEDMLITCSGKIAITIQGLDYGMPQWLNVLYDASGNLLWVRRDYEVCWPTAVREDQNGYLIFAAEATDTAMNWGIGVSKYDTLGNLLWRTLYTNNPAPYPLPKMDIDSMGNIYCAGVGWAQPEYYYYTLKYDFTVSVEEGFAVLGYEVLVYPNPASDRSTFEFADEQERSVIVYDQLGREIWRKKSSDEVIEFPASEFSAGLYFYRIEEAQQISTTGKLIIE